MTMDCYEIWVDLAPGEKDLELIDAINAWLQSLQPHGVKNWRIKENRWTVLDYDDYTNIVDVADSYDRSAKIIFDSSRHLYPEKHLNPLNHTVEMVYDIVFRPNKIIGENNNTVFIQYDDLHRMCRYQKHGKDEPDLITQTAGSANPICNTQDVTNPPERENGDEESSPPLYCSEIECDAGEWCCNVPQIILVIVVM